MFRNPQRGNGYKYLYCIYFFHHIFITSITSLLPPHLHLRLGLIGRILRWVYWQGEILVCSPKLGQSFQCSYWEFSTSWAHEFGRQKLLADRYLPRRLKTSSRVENNSCLQAETSSPDTSSHQGWENWGGWPANKQYCICLEFKEGKALKDQSLKGHYENLAQVHTSGGHGNKVGMAYTPLFLS